MEDNGVVAEREKADRHYDNRLLETFSWQLWESYQLMSHHSHRSRMFVIVAESDDDD